MKNISLYATLVAACVLSACSSKQQSAEVEEESSATENCVTLSDNTTQVFWVKDNPGHKLMDRSLFPEASDSLMEELSLTNGVPASISTFLMKTDGEWTLFDTGLGVANGGQLLEGLKTYGLTPDSISIVYLTHFHGDHIGGLVQDGKAVFANAQVYAGQKEYDAWINEMPKENTEMQRNAMTVYKDQLHLFQFGDTLPHGVVAIDAIGHTPGHTAFQKENLLVIGDLMHGAALQMRHPEISGNYDMDKTVAAESRARILKYAEDNNLIMAGMHLPEPAFITFEKPEADSTGYIVKVGDMAPDFTTTLDDGTQVTLSSFKGKVVMVQFTASWCGVCRKEMPFIESDIWQRHKDDTNFYLMAIDRDEPLETVKMVKEKTGITYPIGLDPSAEIYVKYALRESGITRNVLIDKTGKIVKLTRLYNEEEFSSLVKKIDELLAK